MGIVDQNQDVVRVDVKSGLFCIALLARMKGIRISAEALLRRYGHITTMPRSELIHVFQELGFRVTEKKISARKLKSVPLPAIIELEHHQFALLLSIDNGEALVHVLGQKNAKPISESELGKVYSKFVILAEPKEQADETVKFGLKWFLKTLTKYKSIVRETLFASFFIQLFALVTPLFFMIIIDKVFTHNNLSTLDVLVFALIVVTLFDVLLGGLRTYIASHTTARVDLELGTRFFRHMMTLPLSYFESRRTGDTVARMKEMDNIRQFLTGSSITLFIDVLFVFVFLFVMYLFSPTLANIVVISLPLFIIVSMLVTPLMKSKLEDKHEKLAENQSFMVETLGGIEMIKSSASEPEQQRAWDQRLAALSKCTHNSANLSNVINQITTLISKSLTIILLYFGAKLVLSGELSVGQLIAFNMLTGRVVQPIQRIAGIWQEFTGLKVSVKRLADIMDIPGEPTLLMDRTELPAVQGDIVFSGVSFQYAEDKPEVIRDVSFKVKAGEIVGVVGSTGAGKTTLAKLIQRLYVPSKGSITIDGMDIFAMDGAWLRKQIGVVAQDFVLFNRSIRDNILFGNGDVSDEQLIEVCKMVGAHQMIIKLPQAYDTVLQERGRGLSTGQRQAVAMARALLGDPPILILDEATSALDYASEQLFQSNFKKIAQNRTTFVIAHRLSTLRYVDRVFTLEGGELIEDGSPNELLAADGRFAALNLIHHATWQSQGAMT